MRTSLRPLVPVLVLSLVLLPACDSGGDDAAPAEELTAMFADMQSALTLAFSARKGAMPDFDCPQGGTLRITVNGGGNSFDQDVTYDDCNGIDGTLNLRGTTSFSGQELLTNVTLNGSLSKQCDLTLDDFDQAVRTNLQNPQAAVVTLNGNLSARCSSGGATCSFSNVRYDLASGADTFTEYCR